MIKHFFIVNPVSGKGKGGKFAKKLKNFLKEKEIAHEVRISSFDGEPYLIAKNMAKSLSKNQQARFYSCGGDGTLNEVIKGVYDSGNKKNIAIGAIPIGTGNDFIKCLGEPSAFSNLNKQLEANVEAVDLMEIRGYNKEGVFNDISVNIINIGFDCNVVIKKEELCKYRIFRGPLAYFISILISLIKISTLRLKINSCGHQIIEDEILLTTISNGSFYGGGIKAAPLADCTDGIIDLGIVQKISRIKFLSLLPLYIKGNHVNNGKLKDVYFYHKVKELSLESDGEEFYYCVDGNIKYANKLEIKVKNQVLNFIIP